MSDYQDTEDWWNNLTDGQEDFSNSQGDFNNGQMDFNNGQDFTGPFDYNNVDPQMQYYQYGQNQMPQQLPDWTQTMGNDQMMMDNEQVQMPGRQYDSFSFGVKTENQAGPPYTQPSSPYSHETFNQQQANVSFGTGYLQPIPQQAAGQVQIQAQHQPRQARVPIAPQEPAQSMSLGPMSKPIEVPARKKPGRKPIPAEEAADRRRLQNRNSQRNYRDKRYQELVETRQGLADEVEAHKVTDTEWRRIVAEIEQKQRASNNHIASLERQLADATARLNMMSSNNHVDRVSIDRPNLRIPIPTQQSKVEAAYSTITPPDEVERDFTTFGRRAGATMGPTLTPSDEFTMDFQMGKSCGFCSESTVCACKELNEGDEQADQAPSRPGLCGPCQQDPARAAACQQIAAGASSPRQARQANGPMMSCSQFMDRAQGAQQNTAAIPNLFKDRRLQARASADDNFAVEEHEAAQALQSLARRDTLAD